MEKSSDVRRVREQREPLYVEVKEAILELARTQCGPDRRLPSEEELCRLLGVSRATVREALSILCREGFVSKRHGIGNLVNRSVLDTPMRFDLERGLRRMLEDAGYQASTIREMPVSPGGKDILLDDPTLPVRLTIPRPWKIQRTAHLVEGAQAIVRTMMDNQEEKIARPLEISLNAMLQAAIEQFPSAVQDGEMDDE